MCSARYVDSNGANCSLMRAIGLPSRDAMILFVSAIRLFGIGATSPVVSNESFRTCFK
jgi:hypothetical protein